MQILKGDLSNVKGIPPSGLCVGVHRAGAVHQKMVAKHGDGLAVWSLRPDLDFIAFKKEGLGEQGIRSTSDMESIDAGEKLIYGVRGAPPEVREKAREKGLTLLTIRHYNGEVLERLTEGKTVVLRQQTPETVQVLMR